MSDMSSKSLICAPSLFRIKIIGISNNIIAKKKVLIFFRINPKKRLWTKYGKTYLLEPIIIKFKSTFLLFSTFFCKFLNKLKLNKNLNFLININKIIEQIIVI